MIEPRPRAFFFSLGLLVAALAAGCDQEVVDPTEEGEVLPWTDGVPDLNQEAEQENWEPDLAVEDISDGEEVSSSNVTESGRARDGEPEAVDFRDIAAGLDKPIVEGEGLPETQEAQRHRSTSGTSSVRLFKNCKPQGGCELVPGTRGTELSVGTYCRPTTTGTSGTGDTSSGMGWPTPRRSPQTVATPGEATVVGELTKEAVDRTVKAHLRTIASCYQRELSHKPDLSGRIAIAFDIEGDGSISNLFTESSTLEDTPLEDCVHKRFRKMRFPDHEGDEAVWVIYPIEFAP